MTLYICNVSCTKAREVAAKVASSSSASGGSASGGGGVDDDVSEDDDSSNELHDDTSMLRENDAGDVSANAEDGADIRPSKRSRK